MRATARLLAVLSLAALVAGSRSPPAAAGPEGEYAAAVRAVQAALEKKEPGPLADALYAMRPFDGEPAAKVILAAAFHREAADFVLDAALDALARFQSEEAAEVFAAEAAKSRDLRRFAALEALGRLKNPRAEAAILASVEDSDPRVRTAALRSLADRKEPSAAARKAAERGTLDADPRARSAAMDALSGWQASPGALPLLGRLAVERGRLFEDAWRGLVRISRKTLPPDPEKWADWWRTFPGEDAWHYDAPPPEPPAPSLELAGLHTWSRRLVFAVDTSEGMADAPGYRFEDIAPEDALKAGGPALAEWKAVRTRLDHARTRLGYAVNRLPEDAAFDIHFGGESPSALFRELDPATAANRDRALGRLKGLNGKGRQDFLRLMRSAVAGGPEADPLAPEVFRDGPDTVVYIGTALPSFGLEQDPGRILSTLRRWNRVRQIRFLAVGVGNHGSDLLGGLASIRPVGASTAMP